MIKITGYDIYNGGRTQKAEYEPKIVNNMAELREEKKRIKEEEQKLHSGKIFIYLHYVDMRG